MTEAPSPPEPEWPWATAALSALILLVLLAEELLDDGASSWVLSGEAVLRAGATSHGAVFEGGEWWRLLGAAFCHVALWHALLNGWALIQLGAIVEEIWGPARLVVVYVVSGAASSFLTSWLGTAPSAGASGAIMGLVGFLAVAGWVHDAPMKAFLRAVFGQQLIFWTAVTFALGLGLGLRQGGVQVDNYGHAGGLAAGAVLAFVLRGRGRAPVPLLAVAALLGLVTLVSLGLVAREGGETTRLELRFDETVAALESGDVAAVRSGLAAIEAFPHGAARAGSGDLERVQKLVAASIAAVRTEDALRFGRLAVDLDLERGSVVLAEAWLATGDEAGARRTLDAFRSRAPSEQVRGVALELEKEGFSREALRLLEAELARAPGEPGAMNDLAWTLLTAKDTRVRDPGRAFDLARHAFALAPPGGPLVDVRSAVAILDTLAEAELQQGFTLLALDHEERAVTLASLTQDPVLGELSQRLARMKKADP